MSQRTVLSKQQYLIHVLSPLIVSGIYDDLPYPFLSIEEKKTDKEIEKEGSGEGEVKAGWLTAHTSEALLNGHTAQQFVTGKSKGLPFTDTLSRCLHVFSNMRIAQVLQFQSRSIL